MKNINVIIRLSLLLVITVFEVASIIFLFYKMKSYGLLLYILLLFISIVFVVFKFNNNHHSSNLIWIILILILPGAGCTIYLLFSRQPKTLHYVANDNDEEMILAKTVAYYTNQKSYPIAKIKYLSPGEIAFKTVLEELKKASQYIYIEFYIIENGKMWDEIFTVLKAKRKNNIKVIIVYDDFGCLKKLSSKKLKQIKEEGIELYRFNMIVPVLSSTLNYRNHRKLIIIDGKTAFFGGMNIADEYINYKTKFGYWKDSMILIESQAVSDLASKIDKIKNFPSLPSDKDIGKVQIILDNPFYDVRITKLAILKMINDAKKSIYITTPYFIIDYEIKNALILASVSGISVKIVIPKIPDKKMVYWITKLNLAELVRQNSKIEIYYYLPGFIHSKMIICDDEIVLTGSANFDYRSLYKNFEISAIIYSKSAIVEIVEDFNRIIKESKLLKANDYYMNAAKRLVISLVKVFETLL